MNFAAQHLIPTTNANDVTAAAVMRLKINIPAIGAKIFQITDGGLAAGQDYERRVTGQGVTLFNNFDGDIWLGDQRVEIIEVGNPRQTRHGDFYRATGPGRNIHDILRR